VKSLWKECEPQTLEVMIVGPSQLELIMTSASVRIAALESSIGRARNLQVEVKASKYTVPWGVDGMNTMTLAY
jgi:hypothetical protein